MENINIVLVDSEITITQLLEKIILSHIDLKGKFNEDSIKSFLNGGEAFKSFNNGYKPNILVTDIKMNGISGSELAMRSLILYPDLQVVGMSGYEISSLGKAGEYFTKNNFPLLQKPFEIEEVKTLFEKFYNEL